MTTFEFWLRFQKSLFQRVQSTINQHWFRLWVGAKPGLATSHYLNQWWSSLLMHICVTRPQWVKCWITLKKIDVFLHFFIYLLVLWLKPFILYTLQIHIHNTRRRVNICHHLSLLYPCSLQVGYLKSSRLHVRQHVIFPTNRRCIITWPTRLAKLSVTPTVKATSKVPSVWTLQMLSTMLIWVSINIRLLFE